MKKTLVILCIIIALMIFASSKQINIDDIKEKLGNLPVNKCETFQCEINISNNGQLIGTSKLYIAGNKQRMEIPAMSNMLELGMDDIVIVKDSIFTYTKTKDGWQMGESQVVNEFYNGNSNKQWKEILSKNDLALESVISNKAIIQFKETDNLIGVGQVRVGIDIETGQMQFYELKTSESNSKMIFDYETKKGYSFIKRIKIKTQSKEIEMVTDIDYANVKVNERINQKLFEIDKNSINK